MPLPFIIGGLAAVAGAAGVGAGIYGGMKMIEASDTIELAQSKQERAVKLFERRNAETITLMDQVGQKELEILKSFDKFSNLIEKIQGRPEFKVYSKNGVMLPKYEAKDLRDVSIGAGVILGGLAGAAAGYAGSSAAAGAIPAAVVALGTTASTGTAISTLSGAASTNAILAALGGGSLAAGGGGMALGAAVLGGATLGAGLLIGGIIFSVTGSQISDEADEAYSQALRTEREVNKIVGYLNELSTAARGFKDALDAVEKQYRKRLDKLNYIVDFCRKTNWSNFTEQEKEMTENTILLVGLLYKMCKVNLVIKSSQKDSLNTVNKSEINQVVSDAQKILGEVQYAA